jgi:hypothetical protein
MNKSFLTNPGNYVKTKSKRLSRQQYNARQKNSFLLNKENQGYGIAIVQSNRGLHGKLLFTWGRPIQSGHPSLIIKKAVLYRQVDTGIPSIIHRDINLATSNTFDLDSGKTGGQRADIWFHTIDKQTMYIEAVNGAKLFFPMESLCKPATNKGVLSLATQHNQLTVYKPKESEDKNNNPFGNPNKTIIKRELMENGHILITFSDGSKQERYDGGTTYIAPDGTETKALFNTAAPAAFPVDPPDNDEQIWLDAHRYHLRSIIQSMVEDPNLTDSVLNEIDTSGNSYESVDTRTKIIQRLALP